MNKLVIKAIYTLIFILPFSLLASEDCIVRCEFELRKCFQAILNIPEAKELINNIRKEGSFDIALQNTSLSQQFGAFWDPDLRIIVIDRSCQDDGKIIGSLLFELHNASVTSKINYLNELASQRRINKADYVESMEYLEYINSLNAAKIAQKGIWMGILPRSSQLLTYSSFKEHFRVQKISGHSDAFARNYDLCLLL